MVAGFTSVGMDVVLLGPMPTPGGGDADPVDARRPRRDDLRLPQPVRRQRHQAVRPRRLQAQRQGRAGDREAAGEGAEARQAPTDRPRPADRRRARPLHPVRQVDTFPSICGSTGSRSSSIAPTAPPITSRPRRLWELGAEVDPARRHAQRPQHQRRLRLDPSRNCCRRRWSRAAPTSASRSTATPTG